MVSGDYFTVLGARPVLGRALTANDDKLGAPPVIVLSHRAWMQKFSGDSGIVGRGVTIHESGERVTVAGVMAAGLDFPARADFWAPLTRTATGTSDSLHVSSPMLNIVGRLAPGATIAAARDEMTAFFRRDDAPAMERNVHGVAISFPQLVLGDTRPALIAVSAAAALLLLLACANVANLLLVRGLGRAREVAVRAALGASRGRIVREQLVEGASLSALASVLGAGVAWAGVALFRRIAPAELPRIDELSTDWTMLIVAMVAGAASLMVFSIAPAVLSSRADPGDALRGSGVRATGTQGARRMAEWLVVTQVAFATLVLAAAGLTVRSLMRLQEVNLAVDSDRLLVVELAVRAGALSKVEARAALYEQLATRVGALPGVQGATPALNAPFAPPGHGIAGRFTAPGQTPEQVASSPIVNMDVVAPDYFRTLGTPVMRGRAFNEGDAKGAQPVIVVSEATADFYWPGLDPIGKTLGWNAATANALTVVGVAADTRYRELRIAHPAVYFPLKQSRFPVAPSVLLVRATGRETDLVPSIRRAAQEASADLTVVSARPFEDLLAEPAAQPRMVATLLSIFAASALFLAAVGLFGVISEQLRRRRREFGIRTAIGATPRDIANLVLRRGVMLTAIGACAGIAATIGLGEAMQALLFGVTSGDPGVLVSVTVLLLIVAVSACAVPAIAAARTDPTEALRAEG
jgi:putative ABC transport system permease protein